MKKEVTILGGGNLGTALAKGLVGTEEAKSKYNVTVTRRKVELIKHLEDDGIKVTSDNLDAVENSELLILAVQPNQIEGLIEQIKPSLHPEKHIIISAITGVTDEEIAELTGTGFRIIRVMPNTAAAINQSMTCIESTPHKEAEEAVVELFEAIGKTLVIGTELMEASTVLGACGIAFFLRYIRAASQGGIEVGFHAEEAQLIAAQTALGASALLLESGGHPEHEIDKVTTPKGCTIAGLNEMEHNGLSSALIKGIKTSFEKIAKIR
ncbi:pyrroline-5-carboxylate reductase [Aliifodinibius sp. S!AR15-10]|uniref:pyrroline-5-carboxylate reductase n=1 Tax=Aliifodinibius sp. S!AR15-10 TaxID=2950437 RepID=UPI0028605802|nr:pyrroline-5-carboxylate reductase [Aliifodinibius sp. S!AR15-10]MDR8392188.1 pyrroline-5-carboxylate reductase [Aliifodinibius sp. S!AR15-10]